MEVFIIACHVLQYSSLISSQCDFFMYGCSQFAKCSDMSEIVRSNGLSFGILLMERSSSSSNRFLEFRSWCFVLIECSLAMASQADNFGWWLDALDEMPILAPIPSVEDL